MHLFIDSTFYTKYEAKEILEKSSSILNFICQHNSNVTRYIIEKFDEFKQSLQFFLQFSRNEDSKNLMEAVESEEECIQEQEQRLKATVKIQASFGMYQQKCRWKKLKHGIIALQRLTKKKLSEKRDQTDKVEEDRVFLDELDQVIGKKREMERRYKLISKLHPNRVNSFLGESF